MVYEQITPAEGKVTPSGMVFDKDAAILREVDILIQYKENNFTVAIECRDRSRKDTVSWIEELIGKVGSLPVNKLVAVSKKGFAKPAIRKAKAYGIDTLSVEEAVETDWEKYPLKPGLSLLPAENFHLRDVLYLDGEQ